MLKKQDKYTTNNKYRNDNKYRTSNNGKREKEKGKLRSKRQ